MNPDCPHCKSDLQVIQMSGARLTNHPEDYPLCLCFKCKIWINEKGEMLQTI